MLANTPFNSNIGLPLANPRCPAPGAHHPSLTCVVSRQSKHSCSRVASANKSETVRSETPTSELVPVERRVSTSLVEHRVSTSPAEHRVSTPPVEPNTPVNSDIGVGQHNSDIGLSFANPRHPALTCAVSRQSKHSCSSSVSEERECQVGDAYFTTCTD